MSQKQSKILIIDDKAASFVVFDAIFASSPFSVIKATSGFEALDLINTHDISLFLINVQMPIMDGFETAYRIRKFEKYLQTPMIFITAYDKDQVYIKAPQQATMEDFIFKPFNPQDLRTRVEALVS